MGSLSGDGGSGQVPSGLQSSGPRGGSCEVRGADLVPSAARTDVPGERATSAEVRVQTEPTFQLLEPGPAHVIIRNNVVPVNPVFVALGGRTVHIRRDCWGLRNSQVQERPLCQRCTREFEEGTNLDT